MQAAIETVTVEESVGRYCVALAAATRDHPQVLMGSSPRGALALMLTARAYAVIAGRDYVVPEDVKAVAPSVLGHRVTVRARAVDERRHRRHRGAQRARAGRDAGCPRGRPRFERPRG